MSAEGPLRILIVEDEVMTAIVLEKRLAKTGSRSFTRAVSGEDAVRHALGEPVDLILMDIRLAGTIDGVDAAREILAAKPVPLIFMTGYQDRETYERAHVLGPLAFLNKPLDFDELEALIAAAFPRR